MTMTLRSKSRQSGLSLMALLMISVVVILVAVVGMKCFPVVSEYYTVLQSVKATAQDSSLKGGGVADYRKAFEKRADIAYIKVITAADLDITKEGEQVVISFAYNAKVPLFWKVSLLFEFDGASSGS
jgi:hypothetical protein